jgi:hypothetical protein
MAAGSKITGDVDGPFGTLKPGVYYVGIQAGDTAAQKASILAAMSSLNAQLRQFGVDLIQSSTAHAATISVNLASASSVGAPAGELGQYDGTSATIITGYNYYYGTNPIGIGANQYDFQSVVEHELSHALGLGGDLQSSTSVMAESLATGVTHRNFSSSELQTFEAALKKAHDLAFASL